MPSVSQALTAGGQQMPWRKRQTARVGREISV
jgi:hypothetical protein